MKILIIDDDEMIRKLYCQVFNFEGLEVFSAGTIEEASELLESKAFCVVLTDNRLPDGRGVDLITKFKPLAESTYFILSSADNYLECKLADRILPKPLNYIELLSILKLEERKAA